MNYGWRFMILDRRRFKTIHQKKKCNKAKWLSEEALETAVKRREAKGKGEKGSFTHLIAEFQRNSKER